MNRRAFIASTASALPMFGSGCAIFDHDDGPEYDYPKDIRGTCEQARKDAQARIAKVDGKQTKLTKDCKVERIAGQRFLGGEWAFWSPQWNLWVYGLCHLENPVRIQIAADPRNGAVNYSTLLHESAHYVLWHRGISTHPAQYRGQFSSWVEARSRIVRLASDGAMVIVDGIAGEAAE